MLKREDTIVYREDGIRAPTLNTVGLVCVLYWMIKRKMFTTWASAEG
jgi:hypothetical protein